MATAYTVALAAAPLMPAGCATIAFPTSGSAVLARYGGNAPSQTPAVDRRRSHCGHRRVDALVMPKERALGSTR